MRPPQRRRGGILPGEARVAWEDVESGATKLSYVVDAKVGGKLGAAWQPHR